MGAWNTETHIIQREARAEERDPIVDPKSSQSNGANQGDTEIKLLCISV